MGARVPTSTRILFSRSCFSARERDTYFFPSAIFRMAAMSSSGALSFVRYPAAPVRSAEASRGSSARANAPVSSGRAASVRSAAGNGCSGSSARDSPAPEALVDFRIARHQGLHL